MSQASYEPLADSPIIEFLTPEEYQWLNSATSTVEYEEREFVYKEGDKVDYLYYLASGSIKVYQEKLDGYSYLHLVSRGNFLEIDSCFKDHTHLSSAEACSDTIVAKVTMVVMDRLLRRNNDLCRFFLTTVTQELSRLYDRQIYLHNSPMRARLASTLIYIVELYGYEQDGRTLPIQLSRSDLSALSCMTASNVSRTLTSFVSERMISLEGKRIIILNESALRLLMI